MNLLELGQRWLNLDPDHQTRVELELALASPDRTTLAQLFEAPLGFGTAGLRGPVGAGPAKMNVLTVRVLSLALAEFLKDEFGEANVVVGYDARPDSERFARELVAGLAGAGHRLSLFVEAVPTPLIAFAVRALAAQAGLVVTASHNPRSDAGIKVYDNRGIQIVAPWDRRVFEKMGGDNAASWLERLERAAREPKPETVSCASLTLAGLPAYFAWLEQLARRFGAFERPLAIGYTPLCGVGFRSAIELAQRLELELEVPRAERDPDGTFPHLPFPNPEEPGVLNHLLTTLAEKELDLGAANDPDADRMAAVLPGPFGSDLAMLSGDELGLLLGEAWLELSARDEGPPLVVTTLVSSPGVDAWVGHHGGELRRTLTGFKWICRAADDNRFSFAYEEALGYCFGLGPERPVLDKDGLAALAVVASLARREAARRGLSPGAALRSRLRELAVRDGLWISSPRQVRASDARASVPLFAAPTHIRSSPPETLESFRLVELKDYLGPAAQEPFAGRQDLVSLRLEGFGGRSGILATIHVRPSGTEPKLKFYVHVGRRVASLADYEACYADLQRIGRLLGDELLVRLGLDTFE